MTTDAHASAAHMLSTRQKVRMSNRPSVTVSEWAQLSICAPDTLMVNSALEAVREVVQKEWLPNASLLESPQVSTLLRNVSNRLRQTRHALKACQILLTSFGSWRDFRRGVRLGRALLKRVNEQKAEAEFHAAEVKRAHERVADVTVAKSEARTTKFKLLTVVQHAQTAINSQADRQLAIWIFRCWSILVVSIMVRTTNGLNTYNQAGWAAVQVCVTCWHHAALERRILERASSIKDSARKKMLDTSKHLYSQAVWAAAMVCLALWHHVALERRIMTRASRIEASFLEKLKIECEDIGKVASSCSVKRMSRSWHTWRCHVARSRTLRRQQLHVDCLVTQCLHSCLQLWKCFRLQLRRHAATRSFVLKSTDEKVCRDVEVFLLRWKAHVLNTKRAEGADLLDEHEQETCAFVAQCEKERSDATGQLSGLMDQIRRLEKNLQEESRAKQSLVVKLHEAHQQMRNAAMSACRSGESSPRAGKSPRFSALTQDSLSWKSTSDPRIDLLRKFSDDAIVN